MNIKILALTGTRRKGGNSDILTDKALEGAEGSVIEKIYLKDLQIKPCKGCLRCNLLGYCSIKNDDFNCFRDKFLESDSIIISAPVYYHYIPGELKVLLDRFRSTFHVKMTPEKLIYTSRYDIETKKFLFILTMGHPKEHDAIPAIEALNLFASMTCKNPVIIKPVIATFLAMPGQITASKEKLRHMFTGINIPPEFADEKYEDYRLFLKDAYNGGKIVSREK
ncbi:MAG: flavodoxin family protein [Candidatus Eremiobacterota bacterium]